MRVLEYNAGRNYPDYLAAEGMKALKAIDDRLESIDSIDDWIIERKRLVKAYKDSYPDYMFRKRTPVVSKLISKHEFKHYRLENHIFESYPGWYVNASVYLPKENGIYPGVICATGHSSKTFPNYTSSAQLIARSGYIAVSFDPPGMQGEHHPGNWAGNNHFEDGVRGYLSGFWSQAFFILDAIRCMDYLETRDDVDKACGFAMTGISGGGTSTFHTNIIDDRLTCIAPVCCVSDEAGVTLVDRYTFCCEGKGHANWTNGIKFTTMLALSAPVPMLLCSGARDEVLDYRLAQKTMEKTKLIYKLYESEEAEIFVDPDSGHAYSVPMINKVAGFFDKHMKGIERSDGYYRYTIADIEYPKREQLLCGAVDTATMYTANLDMFSNAGARVVPDGKGLAAYFGVDERCIPKKVYEVFKSKPAWAHTLAGLKFKINDSTDVPGLLLERFANPSRTVTVYADDVNKWDNLENDGFLSKKAAFLQREVQKDESSVLSIDITGIGELKLEPGYYDLAEWSRTDRLFSYLAIVMGTSITAQRVLEILSILNYLKINGEYDSIVCAAKGLASVPMLYASYIFGACDKVVLLNLPVSYESMARHVPNIFMPTSVIYDAPNNFEIYEIANSLKNLTLVNPVSADMTILEEKQIDITYENNVKVLISKNGLEPDML